MTDHDGGPCPAKPSEEANAPGFEAGTASAAAGAYSPFVLHLRRADDTQALSALKLTLPPGLIARLAGTAECSDAALAAVAAKSGAEELASPSCPASSQIGTLTVGAGAGPSPFYAPGKVYLAGPYHGSQLSIVSITAAKVGPFDLGTVVVRFALKINPETAEVSVDGQGSDPIPHTSSTASRSTSATFAPTWIGPSSPSTRPAANRPRPPPPSSARALTSSAPPTTTRSSQPAASRPPTAPRCPSSRSSP